MTPIDAERPQIVELDPRSLILILAVLLFCASVLALRFGVDQPPTRQEWRQAVVRAAAVDIVDGVRTCGVVGLFDDTEPARRCVKEALASGMPFWVLSQARGDDSQIWLLVMRTAGKSIQQILFDSCVTGECRGIHFDRFAEECGRVAFGTNRLASHGLAIEPAVSCER